MQFGFGSKNDRPKQAGRRSKDVLDVHQDWLSLRAKVFSSTMKPQEDAWIVFTPEDAKRINRKNIGRIARDKMKTLLADAHLESDYVVELYKTNQPTENSWCLSVSYEPPNVGRVPARKRA